MWFLNPNITFQDVLMRILASVIIIFTVLPLHEYAHGWVAGKLGDKTAKYSGRLSMNPLDHVDPLGALGILLFGFGWAKPVPIDPRNFKNEKTGMAITALAGPVANLIAALVGDLIFFAIGAFAPSFFMTTVGGYIGYFLRYYVMINVYLAVFNLVPIPPLDGSKILFVFLPDRLVYKFYQYERYIMFALFALLWMGFLSTPLAYLSNFVQNGIDFIAKLPFLWAF